MDRPRKIVNKNGEFDISNIQMEVDAQGDFTDNFRKKTTHVARPGETLKPKGDWPESRLDTVHEFNGHGIHSDPLDRTGEVILDAHVSSLYAQHGVEYASDDVSGAVQHETIRFDSIVVQHETIRFDSIINLC